MIKTNDNDFPAIESVIGKSPGQSPILWSWDKEVPLPDPFYHYGIINISIIIIIVVICIHILRHQDDEKASGDLVRFAKLLLFSAFLGLCRNLLQDLKEMDVV